MFEQVDLSRLKTIEAVQPLFLFVTNSKSDLVGESKPTTLVDSILESAFCVKQEL